MMRKWMLVAVAGFLFLSASELSAQKMGYMNSLNVLSQMPEIAQADTMVMMLRDSLLTEGEKKAKALEEKYIGYMTEINQGTVPPIEIQKREAEVKKEQEALQQYEVEITEMLAARRESYYGPILDKLQKAIDEVGKENGYQFIFDVSNLNIIVFAEESEDVTALVKAKLGME